VLGLTSVRCVTDSGGAEVTSQRSASKLEAALTSTSRGLSLQEAGLLRLEIAARRRAKATLALTPRRTKSDTRTQQQHRSSNSCVERGPGAGAWTTRAAKTKYETIHRNPNRRSQDPGPRILILGPITDAPCRSLSPSGLGPVPRARPANQDRPSST
jgi:hypothetical protein